MKGQLKTQKGFTLTLQLIVIFLLLVVAIGTTIFLHRQSSPTLSIANISGTLPKTEDTLTEEEIVPEKPQPEQESGGGELETKEKPVGEIEETREQPIGEQQSSEEEQVILDSMCRNEAEIERIEAERLMEIEIRKMEGSLAGIRHYWEDQLKGIPNPFVRDNMVNSMMEMEKRKLDKEISDFRKESQAEIDKKYYETYNNCLLGESPD